MKSLSPEAPRNLYSGNSLRSGGHREEIVPAGAGAALGDAGDKGSAGECGCQEGKALLPIKSDIENWVSMGEVVKKVARESA
jgi:hypothetical protein